MAPALVVGVFASLVALAPAAPVAKSERAATSSCSLGAARKLAEQHHLGNAGFTDRPVAQVLCGSFVGSGSRAMAFSLTTPGCGGTIGWVVFRFRAGGWELVMQRNNGAELSAVGTDIKETVHVLRPTDAHCFPTGGTESQIWHWNGKRLIGQGWKKMGAPKLRRGRLA